MNQYELQVDYLLHTRRGEYSDSPTQWQSENDVNHTQGGVLLTNYGVHPYHQGGHLQN